MLRTFLRRAAWIVAVFAVQAGVMTLLWLLGG